MFEPLATLRRAIDTGRSVGEGPKDIAVSIERGAVANAPEPSAKADGADAEQKPAQAPAEPSIPAGLSVLPPPGFTHPLDEALCHLDQQKLSEVLVSRSLIKEGQTYQSCGPDQTKCILSNLPRFLSLAGLDGDSIAC